MRRFVLSIAFVAAVLVATQARAEFEGFTQFAPGEFDMRIQQFMEWRDGFTGAKAIDYSQYGERGTEVKVELLFAWYRGGNQGAANGAMQLWNYGDCVGGFFLDSAGGNDFILGINGAAFGEQGIAAPNVIDLGIALVGSRGSKGIPVLGLQTGMMRDFSMFVDGSWYNLGTALSSLAGMLGVDIDDQAYLNGAKHNSNTVDNNYDKSLTFVWSDMVTGMLGGGGDISGLWSYDDVRFKFDNRLRNQNGLTFIGVTAPSDVPEPATLALVGLGLAGLGLARRRK